MTEPTESVDTAVAEAYEQFMLPQFFGPWIEEMVHLADPQSGESVLDVACGTGLAARLAADCVTASGKVVGVDLDPGMIAVARSHASLPDSATPEWHLGSALEMPFEDHLFDVVFCLQGLQFFPDRVAGLREIRRVMKPSGRLVTTVWCPIEECKGHYAVAQALTRHGIDARAAERPFSLGKTNELRELAQQAGFQDIDIQTVSKFAHFSSPQDLVESLAAGAPSTRRALAQVSESARQTIIEEVSASLTPYVTEAGLAYPNASLVLIARS